MRLPARFRFGGRRTPRDDTTAGFVLGVESVPDGLATGLNPVSGLSAYMFGMAAGALATSSAFVAIQGTGYSSEGANVQAR